MTAPPCCAVVQQLKQRVEAAEAQLDTARVEYGACKVAYEECLDARRRVAKELNALLQRCVRARRFTS